MSSTCATPLPLEMLIAYERGELDERDEQSIEEHYFGCPHCSQRLASLARLGEGIRAVVHDGAVSAGVTEAWLQRGQAEGLRIRNYRVPAGGTVACTAAPDDDFVAIHLELPVSRADTIDVAVAWLALDTGIEEDRLINDLAFDRTEHQVVLLFAGAQVREFPRSRWRMHATVHSVEGEQRFGPYTLEHTPWVQLPDPVD